MRTLLRRRRRGSRAAAAAAEEDNAEPARTPADGEGPGRSPSPGAGSMASVGLMSALSAEARQRLLGFCGKFEPVAFSSIRNKEREALFAAFDEDVDAAPRELQDVTLLRTLLKLMERAGLKMGQDCLTPCSKAVAKLLADPSDGEKHEVVHAAGERDPRRLARSGTDVKHRAAYNSFVEQVAQIQTLPFVMSKLATSALGRMETAAAARSNGSKQVATFEAWTHIYLNWITVLMPGMPWMRGRRASRACREVLAKASTFDMLFKAQRLIATKQLASGSRTLAVRGRATMLLVAMTILLSREPRGAELLVTMQQGSHLRTLVELLPTFQCDKDPEEIHQLAICLSQLPVNMMSEGDQRDACLHVLTSLNMDLGPFVDSALQSVLENPEQGDGGIGVAIATLHETASNHHKQFEGLRGTNGANYQSFWRLLHVITAMSPSTLAHGGQAFAAAHPDFELTIAPPSRQRQETSSDAAEQHLSDDEQHDNNSAAAILQELLQEEEEHQDDQASSDRPPETEYVAVHALLHAIANDRVSPLISGVDHLWAHILRNSQLLLQRQMRSFVSPEFGVVSQLNARCLDALGKVTPPNRPSVHAIEVTRKVFLQDDMAPTGVLCSAFGVLEALVNQLPDPVPNHTTTQMLVRLIASVQRIVLRRSDLQHKPQGEDTDLSGLDVSVHACSFLVMLTEVSKQLIGLVMAKTFVELVTSRKAHVLETWAHVLLKGVFGKQADAQHIDTLEAWTLGLLEHGVTETLRFFGQLAQDSALRDGLLQILETWVVDLAPKSPKIRNALQQHRPRLCEVLLATAGDVAADVGQRDKLQYLSLAMLELNDAAARQQVVLETYTAERVALFVDQLALHPALADLDPSNPNLDLRWITGGEFEEQDRDSFQFTVQWLAEWANLNLTSMFAASEESCTVLWDGLLRSLTWINVHENDLLEDIQDIANGTSFLICRLCLAQKGVGASLQPAQLEALIRHLMTVFQRVILETENQLADRKTDFQVPVSTINHMSTAINLLVTSSARFAEENDGNAVQISFDSRQVVFLCQALSLACTVLPTCATDHDKLWVNHVILCNAGTLYLISGYDSLALNAGHALVRGVVGATRKMLRLTNERVQEAPNQGLILLLGVVWRLASVLDTKHKSALRDLVPDLLALDAQLHRPQSPRDLLVKQDSFRRAQGDESIDESAFEPGDSVVDLVLGMRQAILDVFDQLSVVDNKALRQKYRQILQRQVPAGLVRFGVLRHLQAVKLGQHQDIEQDLANHLRQVSLAFRQCLESSSRIQAQIADIRTKASMKSSSAARKVMQDFRASHTSIQNDPIAHHTSDRAEDTPHFARLIRTTGIVDMDANERKQRFIY